MEDRYHRSRKECIGLLKKIFSKPETLLEKFAPDGWGNSNLYFVHHPTAAERFERDLKLHENLANLRSLSKNTGKDISPVPRLEDYTNKPNEIPVKPYDELIDILGHCVWHVFSENHDVVDLEENTFHLGSWRGSARFIAEFINQHHPVDKCYDYMDFYMGFWHDSDKEKCLPIFIHIFEILKSEELDWVYSFPDIYVVDFEKENNEPDDPTKYDPAKSMAENMEKEERKKKVERLKSEMEEIREAEMEEARYKAPPTVVAAYRELFGKLPEGFPD